MKKLLTFILLFAGLQSFAQKNIDELQFTAINKQEHFSFTSGFWKILGFTGPDSVGVNGKKYTMYFFDCNVKAEAHEEFYTNYIVNSKKMDSIRASNNYSYPQRERYQRPSNYDASRHPHGWVRPEQRQLHYSRENDEERQKLREIAIAKHKVINAQIAKAEIELKKNEAELKKNKEQIRKNNAEMLKIDTKIKKISIEIKKNDEEMRKIDAQILKAKNKKS